MYPPQLKAEAGSVIYAGGDSMSDKEHSHRPSGASRSRNWSGPWPKTPGRLLGTGLVRLYQLTLSGFLGNSCRHLPTCSEYAYEAIARYGLLRGGWLGLKRVARCGPFGTSGFDPVPDIRRRRG